MPAHGGYSESELVMARHLLALTVPTVACTVQGHQRSCPAGSARWSAMSLSCGSTKWTLRTCCPALSEGVSLSSEGATYATSACYQKQAQQINCWPDVEQPVLTC